jgi:hypothetical protein
MRLKGSPFVVEIRWNVFPPLQYGTTSKDRQTKDRQTKYRQTKDRQTKYRQTKDRRTKYRQGQSIDRDKG